MSKRKVGENRGAGGGGGGAVGDKTYDLEKNVRMLEKINTIMNQIFWQDTCLLPTIIKPVCVWQCGSWTLEN